MPLNKADLDAAMLDAHGAGDGAVLAGLYGQAADECEAAGDADAACFYLVQAYVFALDAGLDSAQGFHRRLVAYGREE